MDVLAVFPAVRSAARRDFAGRPLALHAIEQAIAARKITRVAIVTSDAELVRLAEDAGVDVIAPPSRETPADMLRAAIDGLGARERFAPLLATILDPAFPMLTGDVIDAAIDELWRCGADSLLAVRPLAAALWSQGGDGIARPDDQSESERHYVETGALVAVRVGVFERTGELPGGRVVLWPTSALAALRLEDDTEWPSIEVLYRASTAARARARLRDVRLLVLDFDGVMTDNRVLVFEDGREAVLCNRGDGMGLEMLKRSGLPVAVISKEVNPVVGARCKKLKIPYLQGIDNKLAELRRLVDDQGITLDAVAYVGNDVNDAECMAAAGIAIAPSDAHPHALRLAEIVTALPGGFGAVREVCDALLATRAETVETAKGPR
ncbi:MAG: HAD hydrolase family protein [Rhodospirillales bacterium]|nr:HAD hydrolase family protein [Rhodospirillales bacterium]